MPFLSHFKTALAAAVVATAALATDVAATTYNLADDFLDPLGGSNPWSYGGYTTEDTPNTFFAYSFVANDFGPAGLSGYTGGSFRSILQNQNASTVVRVGTQVFEPGEVVLHPNDPTGDTAVRFTTQQAGDLSFDANFYVTDQFSTASHPVSFKVFLNDSLIFSDVLSGYLDSGSDAQTLTGLNAGDTLDFVVGSENNSWVYDLVALDLEVTSPAAVPLPASALLLLGGIGALGFARRRRAP